MSDRHVFRHRRASSPPEETVGSGRGVGAVPVSVEAGAEAVGVAGVAWGLGEGAVELRGPVVLGVAVMLGVAEVGLASVEGEPE